MDAMTLEEASHVKSYGGQGGGISGIKTPTPYCGGGSFANHAGDPNTKFVFEADGLYLKSTKAIKANQWITVNYGFSSHLFEEK